MHFIIKKKTTYHWSQESSFVGPSRAQDLALARESIVGGCTAG